MLRSMPVDGTIEVVRGRMSDERADQLLRFWSTEGGPDEGEAQRRLDEVVCVLLDGAGEIAGANSVYPQDVPLIGGRLFWIYRSLLRPEASSAHPDMIDAAFAALEEEFEPTVGGPIGLCAIVADRDEMERPPEAVWPDTQLMFAGCLEDGRQVRIRYFDGAAIGPGLPNSPTLAETPATQYTLSVADIDVGTIETVAELPGFTRGLAFAGGVAFVGLSQVRETATFGGLPLMERLDERLCGVWAVDPRTGRTLGFIRFEELVQEIFDVALLHGLRYPEIAEEGSDAASQSFVLPDR